MQNIIDLINKKKFNVLIELNIYLLLFIVNFISYSIYSVLSGHNILWIEILINFNFIIFFFFYKKNIKNKLIFKFNLYVKEIIFFTIITFLLIILIFHELNLPLFIDEIAYSRRSTRTSLFSSLIIIDKLNYEWLKQIPIKYIIHFFNLLQLIFICALVYIVKKNKNFKILILFLILNFILRLVLQDSIHHPPLNHIFSSFFVSIFGLQHNVIRLSYFIPFIVFLFIIHKNLLNISNNYTSWIFILSIATFPFLLISSVNPDHSFWGSLIFIFLLFYFIIQEKINYKLVLIIVSIGILFRVSVFSAYILIATAFLIDILRNKYSFFDQIKKFIIIDNIFLIILVSLPLFLISLTGITVFEGLDKSDPISNLIEALQSKQIIISYYKQIPYWYFLFIFFSIISFRKIEFLIFFLFNLLVFFSMDSSLWNMAKYSLEYLIPFVLVGHLIFLKMMIQKKYFFLINLINVTIIVLNINEIVKFPGTNISFDKIQDQGLLIAGKNSFQKNTKYIYKIPYRYDDAYDYLSKINAKDKAIMLGTDYGILPQVISNYNFEELNKIIALKLLYDKIFSSTPSNTGKLFYILSNKKNPLSKKYLHYKFNHIKQDEITTEQQKFNKLNNIKELSYILLTNHSINGNREDFIETLKNNNWIVDREFFDKSYRTTLILFKKINID